MLHYVLDGDDRGVFLRVTCSRGREFLIDAPDRDFLEARQWFVYRPKKAEPNEYVVRRAPQSRLVLLHREIMNAPKGMEVDHRDSDGLNNRRYNMRVVTQGQNRFNTRYRIIASGGYRGVSDLRNGRYAAIISLSGKLKYLGTFDDPIEAALVWDAAALSHRGAEFARLNFPTDKDH